MSTAAVPRHASEGVDLRQLAESTLLPGFTGTTLPPWLERRLRAGLAGVCVFGPNIESLPQLAALVASIREANPRALVAIDEEAGDVTRLHYADGSPYPGNALLGRIDDLAYTEAVARRVGTELRRIGVTLDLAPDADVNSHPDNPVIGARSFGTDPRRVAAHTAAWVRGLQSVAVAACPKHFPGHGDTSTDSHLTCPVVDADLDTLVARELVPFEAAVAAETWTMMTSHILVPALDAERPATLSPTVLGGLLRERVGFDGVVVSDALDMAGASADTGIPTAAWRALAAGCDLLCIGAGNTDRQLTEIVDAIVSAVDEGVLPIARLRDASRRLAALSEVIERAERDTPVPREEDPGADASSAADDLARALGAFDLTDETAARLADARDATVVVVDTDANLAIGVAPWGPLAQSAAEPEAPASRAFTGRRLLTVRNGDDLGQVLGVDSTVIVIGRDNHRRPLVRETIATLTDDGADVITVDMGWPGADRRFADVATFSASRLAGRALLHLLAFGRGS